MDLFYIEVGFICQCWCVEQPAGLAAAVAVGRSFGLSADQATILQETNNTVVWLKPDPVIAKVATRPSAETGLRREHAMALQLAEVEADTARPLSGAIPTRHDETGYVVTFWELLDRTTQPDVAPHTVEVSLRGLHAALAHTTVEVPSFRTWISQAQAALEDDRFRLALPPNDRHFLSHVFRQGLVALDDLVFDQRRLHGEPHEGNRVVTRAGLRWLDFESCCIGPLEWDLASLPTAVATRFPEIDPVLLTVLAQLNSARVATWCWGQTRFPEMRRHGEVHLAILRNLADR